MSRTLPRPTAAYVKRLYSRLTNIWAASHEHWKTIDAWYHQDIEIWPVQFQKAGRSTYIPSTARGIIDTATDTQLAITPTVHREPVSIGTQHRKDANDAAVASVAIFTDSQVHEETPTFKKFGKHLNAYGYSVLKGPVLDLTKRPSKPVRRKGESDKAFKWRQIDYKNEQKSWNPVRFEAPHPSTVLMNPWEGKDCYEAIARLSYYDDELLDYLHERRAQKNGALNRQVIAAEDLVLQRDKNGAPSIQRVLDYWSDDWHLMMLDGGQVLLVERNDLGYCLYTQAFAGMGMQRTNDTSNSIRYLTEGLIDAILTDLKVEAQNETGKHNGLMEHLYPDKVVPDAQDYAAMKARGDGVLEGNKEEFGYHQFPEPGRFAFQYGTEVTRRMEFATYNRTAGGERQQGVSTVGQQTILSASNNRKFASVSMQLNHTATLVVQRIFRLVDRLGESITVAGKTLKPAMLHNDYNATVTFDLIDPFLQLREREISMQEQASGLISKRTYREEARRLASSTEEEERIIEELVSEHPAVIQRLALIFAERDGTADIIKDAENAPETSPLKNLVGPNGKPLSLSPEAGGSVLNAARDIGRRMSGGSVTERQLV